MTDRITTIVLIGTGNVSTILGNELLSKGYVITQVISRNLHHAKELALSLNCSSYSDSLSSIKIDADLYLIAVNDDAVEKVVNELPSLNGIVTHCSGTLSSQILSNKFEKSGVLYPLQTFTKGRIIEFSELPFLIYSHNHEVENTLYGLAKNLSNKVFLLDDRQRAQAHFTAVILNNFTNHLITLAEDFAQEYQLPKHLFDALLKETVEKAVLLGAENSQTGPAIRNDQETVQKHLKLLQDADSHIILSLYQIFTKSITERYGQK